SKVARERDILRPASEKGDTSMRLIDMDTHFSPPDEFAYVPEDLKELTPAWLPQGQGRVAMVTPNWPEAPLGRGLNRPHIRYQGDFDVDSRLRDMDAMG